MGLLALALAASGCGRRPVVDEVAILGPALEAVREEAGLSSPVLVHPHHVHAGVGAPTGPVWLDEYRRDPSEALAAVADGHASIALCPLRASRCGDGEGEPFLAVTEVEEIMGGLVRVFVVATPARAGAGRPPWVYEVLLRARRGAWFVVGLERT